MSIPLNIETPRKELAKHSINMADSEYQAMSNEVLKAMDIIGNAAIGVGGSMMSANPGNLSPELVKTLNSILPMLANFKLAGGGTVPFKNVEVEGKEMLKFPDGSVGEVKGKAHEKGGVDIQLEPGTEVYSKRIKFKGESMAKREEDRAKRIKKAKRKADKNDQSIYKNTLKKVEFEANKEREMDMHFQNVVTSVHNMGIGDVGQMMATGGVVDGIPGLPPGISSPEQLLNILNSMQNPSSPTSYGISNLSGFTESLANLQNQDYFNDMFDGYESTDYFDNVDLSGIQQPSTETRGAGGEFYEGDQPENLRSKLRSILSSVKTKGGEFVNQVAENTPDLTFGDAVGLAGTLYTANKPMENTYANRAGDTPNENHYRNVGREAEEMMNELRSLLGRNRDDALAEVERGGAASKRSMNPRSVNTKRAMNLAVDQQSNQANRKVYSDFANQLASVLGQEANLSVQSDQIRARGEESADMRDRQDRDNFYSQLASDIIQKGQGIQKVGSDLNQVKYREDSLERLQEIKENLSKTGAITDEMSAFLLEIERAMTGVEGTSTTEKDK